MRRPWACAGFENSYHVLGTCDLYCDGRAIMRRQNRDRLILLLAFFLARHAPPGWQQFES